MKPVTNQMTIITTSRVPAIRLARELAIGESRTAAMSKGRKKPPSSSSKSKGRVRRAILDPKARAALAAADPELRAFLEENL